ERLYRDARPGAAAGQGLAQPLRFRGDLHGSVSVAGKVLGEEPSGSETGWCRSWRCSLSSRRMAEQGASQIFRQGLLRGQVCVVSGAGTGLGRATAIELASLGATVIGCGRRPEPVEETVKMIRDA